MMVLTYERTIVLLASTQKMLVLSRACIGTPVYCCVCFVGHICMMPYGKAALKSWKYILFCGLLLILFLNFHG